MSRFRLDLHACTLAAAATVAMMAIGASAASASVFYVNGTTGKDTGTCTSAVEPCKTIGAAIVKSQSTLGAATIEVAAGTYAGTLALSSSADNGITINGAGDGLSGTVIEGITKVKEATIDFNWPGNTATLSNLRVVDPGGQEGSGISSASELTLNNVIVDMKNAGDYAGLEAGEIGTLSMNGGGVTMETGNTGTAIADEAVPLALTGVQITVAEGATGSGVEAELAPISLSNVTISLGDTSTGNGLATEFPNPLSASNVSITASNPADNKAAIEQGFGTSTYSNLQVSGAWTGSGFEDEGGIVTLADSRITTSGSDPALTEVESGEGRGLLLQRSVLHAPTGAVAALAIENSNATLDSSEILGGQIGVDVIQSASKARTLTIASSTIDAGVLGERDGAGVYGVSVGAAGTASVANVNIEGSILLETQHAVTGTGDTATINCAYSDVPNQTQAPVGTEGAIDCANGVNGNTTTEPLTSLFGAPITNYSLLPGSSAVDSVPASAIALPFGLTPSTTDLAGNPRVVDGNGDCMAVRDKGALELQGHGIACPPTPIVIAKDVPSIPLPAITGLTISPSSSFAAPSGATISKASKKAKKTYGASVSYNDSQVATTTFTVLSQTSGRTQGKACKKPSKANKHGKHCTILTVLGSFTHSDTAGANKLHFSGRVKGKKLAKGSYTLQAVPHDAAGNGEAGSKEFKIK
jgi:hypothetical protein